MPTYEYGCRNCKKKFSVVMSFADHARKKPACPKCKSRKVEQRISAFYSKTSSKS